MKVVLHKHLKRDDEPIQLLVSFGGEPARAFLASTSGADPKYKFCSVEEELFMRLSDQMVTRRTVFTRMTMFLPAPAQTIDRNN
jgi:hypothetical protein